MPDLSPSQSVSATGLVDRHFVLLLLLAIVVRGLAAAAAPQLPLTDADGYLAHAAAAIKYQGFVGPFTGNPTAFRPPLYPLLLALPLACGLPPAAAVLLINLLASLACSAAAGWLAMSLLHSRRAAQLCMLATIFDPLLLRYSIQPMTEVPCAALLTLACAACARSMSPPERKSWHVLTGLLFAAATLTRPAALLAAAGICLCLLALALLSRNESAERRMAPLAPVLLTAGLTLGMTPWLLRNALQFHAFIPATTHGGYTLALGNNPDFYQDVIRGKGQFPWDGAALDHWQRQTLAQATQAGIHPADERALDKFHYALARDSIRRFPVDFLQACGLRFRRFWALGQAGNSTTPVGVITAVWYLVLWSGVLLRLLQLSASPRRILHHSAEIPLWICVLAFNGTHLVYWTDARMRTPIMPLLIAIAALGYGSFRRHRRTQNGT